MIVPNAHDRTPPSAPAGASERARSLHRVALHEYAHYHVARAFGIHGRVQIAPRAPDDDGAGREHFSGCFVPVAPMIACHAAQVIALAGVCADVCTTATSRPTAAALLAGLADGRHALSASDADLAGAFGEAHLAEALALVAAAWSEIARDAAAHAAAFEAAFPSRHPGRTAKPSGAAGSDAGGQR